MPYHVQFGQYTSTHVLERLARLADIRQTVLQDTPDMPTFAKQSCKDSPNL